MLNSEEEYNGFQLESSFNYLDVPIRKYISAKTGLSVAVAEIEGPLVNCYITVATEANDHDGCPHVLEHMIFLGSEEYPYKGILDQLANRCLAQGTNAWTDVDHTCYTLTTAGAEGVKRLLPVYMDHILYPTLTDTGFYTEVHHIDGEGKDAGVVYCEMQACENTGSSLVYHKMMETLYENCGYGYNTGGRVSNLRHLTIEKVRRYHKRYYRPDNVRVIVTGKIDPYSVLDAMSEIESKILQKNNQLFNSERIRPWITEIPKFTKTVETTVEFPSNEEESGAIVFLCWRSCPYEDFFRRNALYVLWCYLTDSAVSPLQKEFVENENAICGDITFSLNEAIECNHYIHFKNVVTEEMHNIKPKFFEVMNEIIEKGIDMKRMRSVIKQKKMKHYSEIEEDPHSTFSTELISDFLYSTKENQLLDALDEVKYLEQLMKMDNTFWIQLIKEELIEKPYCLILGKPSIALGEKIAKEEVERLKRQAEELGTEKLRELEQELKRAEIVNNPPVSEELLKRYKVPDVNSISFIPVVTYRTDEKPISEDSAKLAKFLEQQNIKPYRFFIQYDHILSEFVSMTATLDTGRLDSNLRKYLELYLEVIFEIPLIKDGKLISYEEVVYMLEDQSVDHGNGCGLSGGNFTCGSFAQLMWLDMKFERSEFENCGNWLRDFLWNSVFTPERLKVAAKRLINDVARTKRSPNYIARSALKKLNFIPDKSNHISANSIRQYQFLNHIIERLDTEPQVVIDEINEFRRIITDPSTLRIHVTGNIYKIPRAKSFFIEDFLPKELNQRLLQTTGNYSPPPFQFSQELLSQRALHANKEREGYIFPLASTDSGYLHQSCLGLKDFNSGMRAALLVLIEYFTALEGPFWKQIRGKGLSYNYSIQQHIEEGLLYFVLGQSANVVKAYSEAKLILDKYLRREEEFEEVILEASRSAVISEIIATEETMHMAASSRYTQYLRGCRPDSNRILLNQVSKVTVSDLFSCLEQVLSKLFDITHGNCVVVTNPSKVDEIAKQMKEEQEILLQVADVDAFFS